MTAKTDYIQVRLEPFEKEVLKELANSEGMKMADVLRLPIVNEIKRRKRNKKGAIA